MTGYSGVQYDDDQQQAAAPKVIESWDAVTGSRKRTSALGSAQTSEFWGQEAGPSSMGDTSAALFNTMSEVLAKEAALIVTFEAEINAALESFTGTEQDNKLQLAQIQEALNRVDKSDAAAAAKVTRHKLEEFFEELGVRVPTLTPITKAGTVRPAAGGSTTQAPTQDTQPEV